MLEPELREALLRLDSHSDTLTRGPEAPHFIEVEDELGNSIVGEWVELKDRGDWALKRLAP